jgi:hypothetical protein
MYYVTIQKFTFGSIEAVLVYVTSVFVSLIRDSVISMRLVAAMCVGDGGCGV